MRGVDTGRTGWRVLLGALAALALTLGLAACGGSGDGSNAAATASTETTREEGSIYFNQENQQRPPLTIGSKSSAEQEILGEIYAQALAAAGFKVKTALGLGSETAAWNAVKARQISGYPGNSSTALTSLFDFEPQEVPSGALAAKEKANAEFLKGGLETFKPSPKLPSGNVIFVTRRSTAWDSGSGYELTIQQVQEGLTLKAMQKLRNRVELEEETPEEAAKAYLESGGYIAKAQ